MVEDLDLDVEILSHPIVREEDGLAVSSRNIYLSPEERRAALSLSRALRTAQSLVREGETKSHSIIAKVRAEIEKEPLAELQYVSVCDPLSLENVERIDDQAVLALAVRIGKARLIDNTVLKS